MDPTTSTPTPAVQPAPPTITTTLGQLAQAEAALGRLAAQPAPAKTAYHVAKLVRLVARELTFFHERRQALITDLGERRPATAAELAQGHPGEVIQVKAAELPTFVARLQELTDVAVTIPWGPVALDAFGEIQITAADINDLGDLLTG